MPVAFYRSCPALPETSNPKQFDNALINLLKNSDFLTLGQASVRCRQCEAVDHGGRGNKTISGITVRQCDGPACERNVESQRSLRDRAGISRFMYPCMGLGIQLEASTLSQQKCFSKTDRREPQLVLLRNQRLPHTARQPLRSWNAPKPHMGVEQQLHRASGSGLRASHSEASATGATMSPTIRPRPSMHPSQSPGRSGRGGGTICATGLPNRVTNTGLCVLPTRSNTERQVALNLDICISSIPAIITWSNNLLQYLSAKDCLLGADCLSYEPGGAVRPRRAGEIDSTGFGGVAGRCLPALLCGLRGVAAIPVVRLFLSIV